MGDEFDICHYGSTFGRDERLLMRITVKGTDDPSSIFPDAGNPSVPPYLKHLELEGFGVSQFLKYRSRDYPSLGKSQRLFAQRLQDVLLNRVDSSCKHDMYLHDLVEHLVSECCLNDGLDLYTRASKLPLTIAKQEFLVFSNKEGWNRKGIVWTLQECKLKFDNRYRKGDIQLAASLIAACQANLRQRTGFNPRTMYGLKVLGEEFFFCKIDFDTDYPIHILNPKTRVDFPSIST
ncbi:hypothetical protein KP509_37G008400 [Ceratopteris richardii]|uniref:Uncharacterized protein n=2 Tax=Ceratopteris richardii TaxID=49495 RepID=A0A8T2Q688_CERRI|nr:hypothetical protein KP509_37G008400 [Ceratopteris richardii]KAH7279165.1 hypothetical protein KP509_37G008400 [Ceratopteris richardii]